MNAIGKGAFVVALLAAGVGLATSQARAHCDAMDGPVVGAARDALAGGDVRVVLPWVEEEDELEIRKAFDRALEVRKLGPEAQTLADTWFFETLVRVHRAGEGAPYTGVKPAGGDLGPVIPLADEALATGNVDPLVRFITDATRAGIAGSFGRARMARSYASDDVEAGREYVRAYVTFVHYVEGVYEAASPPVGGDSPEDHAREDHHQ